MVVTEYLGLVDDYYMITAVSSPG